MSLKFTYTWERMSEYFRRYSVSWFSFRFFCALLSKVRHHWLAFYPWGSTLHKQLQLEESTLYWALGSFNLRVTIAFTNIIRNPLLVIMDLYSIAGSHLSHQVTLPGLLDNLDNIISPAHTIIIFLQHTLWMISKYRHASRQDPHTLTYQHQYSN